MRSKVVCWITGALAVLAINAVAADSVAIQNFRVKPGEKISIQTAEESSPKLVGYYRGSHGATLYYTPQGTYVVDRAITDKNLTVFFPLTGARYDTLTDSIAGIDANGDSVRLALREVRSVGIQYASEDALVDTSFCPDMARKRLGNAAGLQKVEAVPVDSIQSLKVWRTANAGLFVGLLAGGLIGYGIGTGAEDDTENWLNDDQIILLDKGAKMAIDVTLGAVIGAFLGYKIGGGNGWRDVDLGKPKLSIVPQLGDRPGLAVAVRF